MIKAIIYDSNTGFTKQFAYSFAASTGLPIYTLKEAKKTLNKNDNIIFFSWIQADKIHNIKKAKRYNIAYAAAVGLRLYNEELVELIKKNSKVNNVYYLEGGIRWRMLGPFQRLMMKMILAMLKSKKKKNKATPDDIELINRLNLGYENINLDSLNILIEWYNSQKELVA
jgi:hypothetical protein